MTLPIDLKRIAIAVLVGGTLGFLYQKVIGCRTGACPLTATPLRAIIYGVVLGLVFAFSGGSKRATDQPREAHSEPIQKKQDS